MRIPGGRLSAYNDLARTRTQPPPTPGVRNEKLMFGLRPSSRPNLPCPDATVQLLCNQGETREDDFRWERATPRPDRGALRFRRGLNGFPFHLSDSQFRMGNQKMP